MKMLHVIFRGAVLGSLLVAATAPVLAQDKAGDPANGKKLFLTAQCYQCHGTFGQGGGRAGPKLAPNPLPAALIIRQLRHPQASMPIYTVKVLSDAQAADIIAFLQSVKPGQPAKDIPLLNIK